MCMCVVVACLSTCMLLMPVTVAAVAADDNCTTTNKYKVIHKRVYLCPCGFSKNVCCCCSFLLMLLFYVHKIHRHTLSSASAYVCGTHNISFNSRSWFPLFIQIKCNNKQQVDVRLTATYNNTTTHTYMNFKTRLQNIQKKSDFFVST